MWQNFCFKKKVTTSVTCFLNYKNCHNMKNNETIRNLLGISQKDLALLLRVSRSQIAMYELGKRNLPIHATEKLAKIVLQIQNETNEIKKDKASIVAEQYFLQKALLKNNHQQLLTERKIEALEKKLKILEFSRKAATVLIKTEMVKIESDIIKHLISKSNNNIAEKNRTSLLQLQIKNEVLKHEEKLLKEKLKSSNNVRKLHLLHF